MRINDLGTQGKYYLEILFLKILFSLIEKKTSSIQLLVGTKTLIECVD